MSSVAAGSAVASVLPAALDAVLLSGSASVTDAAVREATQRELEDFLARLYETRVALSLPACSGGAEGDGVLRLVWRARVVVQGNGADAFTTTRLVRMSTLAEDVLDRAAYVQGAEGAEEAEEAEMFGRAVNWYGGVTSGWCARREEGVRISCVGRGKQGAVVEEEVGDLDSLLAVAVAVGVDEVAGGGEGDDGWGRWVGWGGS